MAGRAARGGPLCVGVLIFVSLSSARVLYDDARTCAKTRVLVCYMCASSVFARATAGLSSGPYIGSRPGHQRSGSSCTAQ